MEETLISFETAVLAKEKGLDLITTFFYTKLNSKMFGIDEHGRTYPIKNTPKKAYKCGEEAVLHVKNVYSAPTQGLLQKWLREVHGINIVISPSYRCFNIIQISKYNEIEDQNEDVASSGLEFKDFETYEKALEFGLFGALKLIK